MVVSQVHSTPPPSQQVYKRYVTDGGATEVYRLIACFEEEPGPAAITQAFQDSAKQEGN